MQSTVLGTIRDREIEIVFTLKKPTICASRRGRREGEKNHNDVLVGTEISVGGEKFL